MDSGKSNAADAPKKRKKLVAGGGDAEWHKDKAALEKKAAGRRRKLTPGGGKAGKAHKTVAFKKTDGTSVSFKARKTRAASGKTNNRTSTNYVSHARKKGRRTVSGGD